MGGRIIFTPAQQQTLISEWGKRSTEELAERFGCSRNRVTLEAKRLGCPALQGCCNRPLYTAEDVDLMRQCIAKDMKVAEIRDTYFPDRTRLAVKEFRKRLLSGKPMRVERPSRRRPKSNLNPAKAEDYKPKPPSFPPLRCTIDECPRVTLEYAIQWMRQQVKGWQRPDSDRDTWRAINAQRINGPIPVPPFLPISMPRMHDTHLRAPIDLPAQSVGASG